MSGACFKKLTLIRGSRSVNHFYLEKRLDKIHNPDTYAEKNDKEIYEIRPQTH